MEQPDSSTAQDQADYAKGVEAAHEWAAEHAGYGDLHRVLLVAELHGALLTDLHILDALDADDADVFGDAYEDTEAETFVRGFVDGARQVQESVDEALRKRRGATH